MDCTWVHNIPSVGSSRATHRRIEFALCLLTYIKSSIKIFGLWFSLLRSWERVMSGWLSIYRNTVINSSWVFMSLNREEVRVHFFWQMKWWWRNFNDGKSTPNHLTLFFFLRIILHFHGTKWHNSNIRILEFKTILQSHPFNNTCMLNPNAVVNKGWC